MKKKNVKTSDAHELMAQIQEQLAVLDRKLEQFMTKSLKELAEALAASKPAHVVHVPAPAPSGQRPADRSGRQMYAVVCFDCGKDTEIPFKPSGDRPVYCKECFTKRRSPQAPKPNTSPSIQPSVSEPAKLEPAASKKKPAPAKKPAAKKKVAAKKTAKRK